MVCDFAPVMDRCVYQEENNVHACIIIYCMIMDRHKTIISLNFANHSVHHTPAAEAMVGGGCSVGA